MIDPRASLLIAGCVLFGALFASQLYGGAEDAITPTPAAARADAVRAVPRAQPARRDELLATTLARPLFSPARRPPEAAQTTASELSDKRLSGIVVEPDRRFAIFAVTGAKPLTVVEGDSVDGWRVESITPNEISLVGPKGNRTLQPAPDKASVPQPRPPRGNAASRPAPQSHGPPAQPAQAAAAQPPGGPPRQPPPPGRAAGVQTAPAAPPNRPPPAQIQPDSRPNAPAAPFATARPGQRP